MNLNTAHIENLLLSGTREGKNWTYKNKKMFFSSFCFCLNKKKAHQNWTKEKTKWASRLWNFVLLLILCCQTSDNKKRISKTFILNTRVFIQNKKSFGSLMKTTKTNVSSFCLILLKFIGGKIGNKLM